MPDALWMELTLDGISDPEERELLPFLIAALEDHDNWSYPKQCTSKYLKFNEGLLTARFVTSSSVQAAELDWMGEWYGTILSKEAQSVLIPYILTWQKKLTSTVKHSRKADMLKYFRGLQ
jgi:hypothetical protein